MLHAFRPSTAPLARRALALLIAAAATGGLAACNGDRSAQTEDLTGAAGEAQDVVQKLADRAERDDAAGICRDLLATELRTALGDGDCADRVKDAIRNADYTSLNVVAVKLDGPGLTAVAQVKPVEDADARRSITLKRSTKTAPWTISALDPTGKTTLPGSAPVSTSPAETTPASTPKR